MNHVITIGIGIVLGFIGLTLYACLVAAGRADRQMEAMMAAKQQESLNSDAE